MSRKGVGTFYDAPSTISEVEGIPSLLESPSVAMSKSSAIAKANAIADPWENRPCSATTVDHPLFGTGTRLKTSVNTFTLYSIDELALWLYDEGGILGQKSLSKVQDYVNFQTLAQRYTDVSGDELLATNSHINHYRMNTHTQKHGGFTLKVRMDGGDYRYLEGCPLNVPTRDAVVLSGFFGGTGSGITTGICLWDPLQAAIASGFLAGSASVLASGMVAVGTFSGVMGLREYVDKKKHSQKNVLERAIESDRVLHTHRNLAGAKPKTLKRLSEKLNADFDLALAFYNYFEPAHAVTLRYTQSDSQRVEETFAYLVGKRNALPGLPEPLPEVLRDREAGDRARESGHTRVTL